MNKMISLVCKKSLYLIIILLWSNYVFAKTLEIRSFDHIDKKKYTRLVIEPAIPVAYSINIHGSDKKYFIELKKKFKDKRIIINNKSELIKQIITESTGKVFRVHLKTQSGIVVWRSFVLDKPFRIVVDLIKGGIVRKKTEIPRLKRKMNVEKEKEKPKKRIEKVNNIKPVKSKKKLEIKEKISTICLDAGHGGENYGAIGKYLKEKDITLKIANELKKLILSKLRLNVVMVRDKDIDIPLNRRAEIANKSGSDIFISIHVNSSLMKKAKGPETFFVSLKATDSISYELAKKENMSFKAIEKNAETDELKMILWNMAQTDYIRSSSKLAEYVQQELNILFHTTNRGVKQAPFRVLMRTAMPAILLEAGFISNRKEEKLMLQKGFYKKIAMSIFKGLKKYIER